MTEWPAVCAEDSLQLSMGRRSVRLGSRKKSVKWRKIAQYSLKTPHHIIKTKLTNDWISKTCLSTFKQLFSHILTVKEKSFAWIMSLNSYFKQKWLEKLLWADGKGCSNQGQFYLGGSGRDRNLTEKKEQMEMENKGAEKEKKRKALPPPHSSLPWRAGRRKPSSTGWRQRFSSSLPW